MEGVSSIIMNLRNYFYSLATDKTNDFIADVIKFFLFILSLFYGLGVRILIFSRSIRAHRLNCKVLSVGNITLGGTGKTPLVELIARHLKESGRKVAILSRGYKRKFTGYGLRLTGYEEMGDEPSMLQKNLGDVPVIVDADRVRGADKAIRDYRADTLILDDGLQQWKIKKDLEIVAIDAVNPLGNRHLLPRGILREPLSSLKRASIFVLTKTDLSPQTQTIKDFLSSINPQAQIVESVHRPMGFYLMHQPDKLLAIEALKGKTATLFCGIADPESFSETVVGLGINVGLFLRFPDHYAYRKKDLEDIVKKSKAKDVDAVITTEKDLARIPPGSFSREINFFVLRIALQITSNEKEFIDRIQRICVG